MIRNAAVAGQFYPGDPAQLRATLAELLPHKDVKQDVIGALLPHAGYIYSGKVAGAVLSRINIKDTAIIIGPNHTGRGKAYSIMTEGTWTTPLGEIQIDTRLAKAIATGSPLFQEDSLAQQYEHSVEVEAPFLQYLRPDIKIVPIVFAYGRFEDFRQMGREIATAIKATGTNALIIASSDMTHYERQEMAMRKDSRVIEAFMDLREDELWRRVTEQDISMCGFAPAVTLISAARELGAKRADLVLYQTSGDTTHDYEGVVGYAGLTVSAEEVSPLVKLAKQTVETYVQQRKTITPPANLMPEMQAKAGVFVSIHKFDDLRGCIGTFEPQRTNVAQEIIMNAISAATKDPRFERVTADELPFLNYSVDVLTEPRPVKSKDELDPKKYGVIAECGWRRGLLLPDLEGVDTVEQQIGICCQKAGIGSNETIRLSCFEVKRYK